MSKNAILLVALIAVVILLFVATKLNSTNNKAVTKPVANTNSTTVQKPVLDRVIDINDVVTDPPVYKDLTLTLDGHINDWVTKYAYTFTPVKTGFGNSGKSLPVISRYNYNLPAGTPETELALGEVANIKVTGRIVIFDRATVEKEWNIVFDGKEIDRWNKTPVILLEKIEKL